MTRRLAGAGLCLLGLACATPAPKPAPKFSLGRPLAAPVKPAPAPAKPKPVVAKPAPVPPPPVPAPPPAPVAPLPTDPPYLLAARASLADYRFFANGGFDAGWNVGYHTCWVVKLPPAPGAFWTRAYVGAKLGAAKTASIPGRPGWDQEPIAGEIHVAVAAQPVWPVARRRPLARAEELPLAGNPTYPLDGVGEARWVWTEIPVTEVSMSSPNYVVLFSPDERLKGAGRSPVLAGAVSDNRPNAWLNTQVSGAPPAISSEATRTPVGVREPAVAIKLVMDRDERPTVTLRHPPERPAANGNLTLDAAVSGVDIESAWIEVSIDGRSWRRGGRPVYGAPYVFTLTRDQQPKGPFQVRVAAKDQWEMIGLSPAVVIKGGK